MRLQYCHIPDGNFGDDLNPWLWPRVAPELFDSDASVEFLGIGTILANTYRPGIKRIVFGSGAGYKRPPVVDANWQIYCLRGPRTAAMLNVDRSLAITDSAALVAALPWDGCKKRFDVSYMPHHYSAALGDWRSVCDRAGLNYIDPSAPVETTIECIRQSKLLITEALHGAVVADALRVPWIAVRAYGHILPLKWHDWCESLGMAYRPTRLPSLWQTPLTVTNRVRHLAKRFGSYIPGGKEKWRWSPVRSHGERRIECIAVELARLATGNVAQLSRDETHESILTRLTTKLEELKNDYAPSGSAQSRVAA